MRAATATDRAGPALIFWIGVGLVAFLLVPWYGIEEFWLFEWATDGYLRATVHRVVAPAEGTDRISVPFFFNPRLDAELPRLQIADEFRAAARGVEQDPDNVIHGTYGENLLKSRLRAHPDVAAIHHPQLLEVPAGV